MYSAPYGFQNAAGPAFNGSPPPQNPHLQPAPGPNQPPQQMMYNQQQYPVGAQGPYPGPPNMMPGAGPAGMMQNTGMPHMAANGQVAYQTPYTSSPYGAGIPSSHAPQPQLPPNFNMMGGQMPAYAMNAGGMPQQQQQMMQRMHPSQQNAPGMGVSTPQRQFNAPQTAPGGAMPPQQQQFSTPPNPHGTPQSQTATNAPPPNPSISTPQTPTFPVAGPGPTVNGNPTMPTPMSPGTESREKQAFSLLLEINQELLLESIQLQNTQQELKKEAIGPKTEDGNPTEQANKPSEDEKLVGQDYVHCMRRLQANLSYLAGLADRKSSSQVKGPQFLTPPSLNLNLRLKSSTPTPASESGEVKVDLITDRDERDKCLKELYGKLQALYPGVDPRKEPAFGPVAPNPGVGGPAGHNVQRPGGSNQASPAPASRKTPQMAAAPAPRHVHIRNPQLPLEQGTRGQNTDAADGVNELGQ